MKISFIGAGKVATSFGKYLRNNNYELLYYYSKSLSSSIKAASFTNAKSSESLLELIKESDLIFITTSDDQIENVVSDIDELDFDLSDKCFSHMSGALTSDLLIPLRSRGAKIYSLHPLQSFSDIDKAVGDLKDTYFALEGDDLEFMIQFLDKLSNPYFTLTVDQKIKYHLSACTFSNYLTTLMDFGLKMLNDIGINSDDGLKAMDPLIMATYNNIKRNGTKEALTGPIQRGDINTLSSHMSQIDGLDLEVYKSLGKMTTERLVDSSKKNILNKLWER